MVALQTYGTLSVKGQGFPVQVTIQRRSVTTSPATGYRVARRLRSSYSRNTGRPETRVWNQPLGPLGPTDRAALRSLWTACHGGTLPFLWQPPGEVATYPVVMVQPEYTEVWVRGTHYRTEWQMEELV